MELMSSILLCALVASPPQALGESKRKYSSLDNEFSDHLFIKKKSGSTGTNILLNKNTPLQNRISDLQLSFMVPDCRGCERPTTAQMFNIRKTDIENFEKYQEDRNIIRRNKRKVDSDATITKKRKNIKPKKSKGLSVVKYDDNGKIFALKITETKSVLNVYNKTETVTTCQIYSVKKYTSCELPEANIILSGSKKKINKKGKKGHGKRDTKSVETFKRVEPIKNVETVKGVVVASGYTKRNAEDSQIAEQIMPSIEEMYSF